MARKRGDQYRYSIAGENRSTKAVREAQRDLKRLGQSIFEFSGTVDFATNIAGKMVAGLQSLARAFAAPIEAAQEQERVERQLAAVIKSTAGAAGISADAAKELASAYQTLTTYGDEAIINAQNLLLTFTNISADGGVFQRAVGAILDVSTAMDQDLKSSAVQLGKALNDPILGISALTRVGITFSDAQKEMIRTLAETNRVAEAQTVILDELDRQFGGSAAAARDTFGGAVQSLQNAWGDLLEELGQFVTENPKIRRALESITSTLLEMVVSLDTGEGAFADLRGTIEGFVDEAAPALLRGAAEVADGLAGNGGLAAAAIRGAQALQGINVAAVNVAGGYQQIAIVGRMLKARIDGDHATLFELKKMMDKVDEATENAAKSFKQLGRMAEEAAEGSSNFGDALREAADELERGLPQVEKLSEEFASASTGAWDFADALDQLKLKLFALTSVQVGGVGTAARMMTFGTGAPSDVGAAAPAAAQAPGFQVADQSQINAEVFARQHEERMERHREYQALLQRDSEIMLSGLQSVFVSAAAGFESLSEGWRRFTDGAKAQFMQALTDPIFGAQSALNELLKPVFDVFRSIGQAIHDTLIKPLVDGIVEFFSVKVTEEAAAAEAGAGIHAAAATQTAGVTLGAVGAMMPALSAAAAASLIATFGGAASAAGLLPGLLGTAKATGAAAVAFAEGGYVTGPTWSIIGEDGAESVIPETKPRRARKLLGEMFERRPELAPGLGGTTINVSVHVSGDADGDQIGYEVARAIDERLGGLI